MEGIPDHHEASAFTRGVNGGLGVVRILRPVRTLSKEGRTASLQQARRCLRREVERIIATGVSEARSDQHRGKKTPTLVSPGREAVELELRVRSRSAEAVFGRRETPGPPAIPHGALVSVGRPRGESCESEPGTREVRVHAIVWVADVGWTHRASSAPSSRKAWW